MRDREVARIYCKAGRQTGSAAINLYSHRYIYRGYRSQTGRQLARNISI
ncbi:hypothetical protein BDFG_04870 [Blastomyces dermatitidis ATCC 26199]|nr:hypothetical protein BDFG_04870 [Blastomyces dermatitidis ATCC 26199]